MKINEKAESISEVKYFHRKHRHIKMDDYFNKAEMILYIEVK